jgi:FixJ family two-component response regulator
MKHPMKKWEDMFLGNAKAKRNVDTLEELERQRRELKQRQHPPRSEARIREVLDELKENEKEMMRALVMDMHMPAGVAKRYIMERDEGQHGGW